MHVYTHTYIYIYVEDIHIGLTLFICSESLTRGARPSAPVCARGSTAPVARRYSLLCLSHDCTVPASDDSVQLVTHLQRPLRIGRGLKRMRFYFPRGGWVGPKKPTRVAAPSPRAKPWTAYGMQAHGAALAAGLRSAMKLRLYGYTAGCKFYSCCRSTEISRQKWLYRLRRQPQIVCLFIYSNCVSECDRGFIVMNRPWGAVQFVETDYYKVHIYLSIYIHPSAVSIYLSMHLSIYLSIYPYIYLSIHLSIYLFIYLSG